MSKIIPVIVSGGIGTRLWPISRENHPKQFLKIDGIYSLFQKTILRAVDKDIFSEPIIICNESHKFKIASELEDLNVKATIIIEPIQKNTASAIALAAHYAYKHHGSDATILVLPADHIIKEEDVFLRTIESASKNVSDFIITFGIKSTLPSVHYGYMNAGSSVFDEGFRVEKFVEKPELNTAVRYLESGKYFWNSGMFLFTVKTYLSELKKYLLETFLLTKECIEKAKEVFNFLQIDQSTFEKCSNISIDYGILEKTDKACIMPLNVSWHDLGTWASLYEYYEKDTNNNAIIGENIFETNSKNCMVYSNSNKHVVLNNLEDLIIAVTEDAILIINKNSTDEIKKIYKDFQDKNNDIVKTSTQSYRPWGYYKDLLVGENHRVKLIRLNPHSKISLQYHHKRAEHWVITKGEAYITKGDKKFILKQDESIYIPSNEVHMIENKSDSCLEFIEVQVGSYVGEDDIVRLEDKYGRETKK